MTAPCIRRIRGQVLDLPGFVLTHEIVRAARARRREREMWADYTAHFRETDPQLFYSYGLGRRGPLARCWRYLRGLWK